MEQKTSSWKEPRSEDASTTPDGPTQQSNTSQPQQKEYDNSTEASYPYQSDEVNWNSSPEPWTTILGPCTKGQQNSGPHDAPQHHGFPKHKPRNTHQPCLSRCCSLPFQANANTHRTTLLGPWTKELCAGNKHNGTRSDIFYHTMYIDAAHRGAGAKYGGWGALAGRFVVRDST